MASPRVPLGLRLRSPVSSLGAGCRTTSLLRPSSCQSPFSTTTLRKSAADDVSGLYAALPHDRHPYRDPEMTVDHLVVGGGVVGLAITAELGKRYPDKSTFLVERHRRAGEETSSRNSEVIHAGLYYPAQSLKTQLCIRGRELMYQRCAEADIGYRQTGKLVVGPRDSRGYFEKMKEHIDGLGPLAPPVKLISGDEAREMEPDLSSNIGWAMLSERTGIVSSHELMESLEHEITSSESAELVYDTELVRIDPHLPSTSGIAAKGKRGTDESQEGWVVQTRTHSAGGSATATSDSTPSASGQEEQTDSILARVVINAAGLNGHLALNALRADRRFAEGQGCEQMGMWYSKGNYVSYKGPGIKNVSTLIYPVPAMAGNSHSHQSLGTHLTLDLNGNVKFGPDTEWLSPPLPPAASSSSSGKAPPLTYGADFWQSKLAPILSDEHLAQIHASITSYLPGVALGGLSPDYAGIRPKLIPPTRKSFMDFTLLWHWSRALEAQKLWSYAHLPREFEGAYSGTNVLDQPYALASKDGSGGAMLTLAGIESPGLTSSLAIGEMVADMVAEQVWGHGDAIRKRQMTRQRQREQEQQSQRQAEQQQQGSARAYTATAAKTIPRGARNEEVGGSSLDAWA